MRADTDDDLIHPLNTRPRTRQTIEAPDTLNEAKSATYTVLRTGCRHARAPQTSSWKHPEHTAH